MKDGFDCQTPQALLQVGVPVSVSVDHRFLQIQSCGTPPVAGVVVQIYNRRGLLLHYSILRNASAVERSKIGRYWNEEAKSVAARALKPDCTR